MSVPAYDSYRDSGVEWLGKVPSHWCISRLGFEAWVRARLGWKGLKAEEYVVEGFALLSTPDIKGPEIDFDGANRITRERYEESPEIMIQVGDVLLAKDGSTLGTVNLVRELKRPATVNSSIAVISPGKRVTGEFLLYHFQADHIVARIEQQKGGMGVPHLFQDDLVRFPVALPPISEQTLIAAFLDRETGKIDALVEAQRRLIGLVTERIRALVLPNLDGPSMRFGSAAMEVFRPVLQREGKQYEPLGLYNRGRGLFHKEMRPQSEMGDSDFFWVEEGDLLISGQFAWEGALALAGPNESGCVVSHRYPILRGRQGIARTEFLAALLGSHFGNHLLNENSRGAAGRNRPLNIRSLLKERVPIAADYGSQEAVVAAINLRAQLVEVMQEQTALLQERRSALISAAVTGKIDVRGLADQARRAAA